MGCVLLPCVLCFLLPQRPHRSRDSAQLRSGRGGKGLEGAPGLQEEGLITCAIDFLEAQRRGWVPTQPASTEMCPSGAFLGRHVNGGWASKNRENWICTRGGPVGRNGSKRKKRERHRETWQKSRQENTKIRVRKGVAQDRPPLTVIAPGPRPASSAGRHSSSLCALLCLSRHEKVVSGLTGCSLNKGSAAAATLAK